jgi:hypothetical protein
MVSQLLSRSVEGIARPSPFGSDFTTCLSFKSTAHFPGAYLCETFSLVVFIVPLRRRWKLLLSEFKGRTAPRPSSPSGGFDYSVLEQSVNAIIEALFSPESYPQQHEIFDEVRRT